MASSPIPVTFPVSQDFSLQRVRDHISLMRRFHGILNNVRSPPFVTDKDFFPKLPEGATGTDVHERWRVQAFLMSAEIRYARYLHLLHEWVADNPERSKDKDLWPLPPWYVTYLSIYLPTYLPIYLCLLSCLYFWGVFWKGFLRCPNHGTSSQ